MKLGVSSGQKRHIIGVLGLLESGIKIASVRLLTVVVTSLAPLFLIDLYIFLIVLSVLALRELRPIGLLVN